MRSYSNLEVRKMIAQVETIASTKGLSIDEVLNGNHFNKSETAILQRWFNA